MASRTKTLTIPPASATTVFPLTPEQLAEFRKLEAEAAAGVQQIQQQYNHAVGLMARGIMAGSPPMKIVGFSDDPPGLLTEPAS